MFILLPGFSASKTKTAIMFELSQPHFRLLNLLGALDLVFLLIPSRLHVHAADDFLQPGFHGLFYPKLNSTTFGAEEIQVLHPQRSSFILPQTGAQNKRLISPLPLLSLAVLAPHQLGLDRLKDGPLLDDNLCLLQCHLGFAPRSGFMLCKQFCVENISVQPVLGLALRDHGRQVVVKVVGATS